MTVTETRPAPDAKNSHKSDLTIASVAAIRLKLPYKKPVSFAGHTESTSHYVILRIALADGTEGIAESVCRPGHTGEDAVTVAYQLETFFKPLLLGADPRQPQCAGDESGRRTRMGADHDVVAHRQRAEHR